MKFTFTDNTLLYPDSPLTICESSDFWRIFLDDGVYREITVHSAKQTPCSLTQDAGKLTIAYDRLLAEDGKEYAIDFKVFVYESDGGVGYDFEVAPKCGVRVNEVMCPYIELADCGCAPEDEELFYPGGLGNRAKNPRRNLALSAHSEYKHADYHGISRTFMYPGVLTMPWMSMQIGSKLLYLASESASLRMIAFTTGTDPRHGSLTGELPTPEKPLGIDNPRLTFALSYYPAAIDGECLYYDGSVLKLFDGDFRVACEHYRAWSEKVWFKPLDVPEWIQNMTGFQRIIMKHQYGEIFFRYRDLPTVYRNGAKYGINTLLVFGWWKGCFDNHYPEYELDPDLGTEEEFKAAIAEIQSLGGRVHMYSNGNLIDKTTDFYKNIGTGCCAKDIDGNPYEEHYRFSNEGTLLRMHGYKSFVTACSGAQDWSNRQLAVGRMKLGFGSDTIFYDQLACCFRMCFDKSHRHGNRIDTDLHYRRENILKIRELIDKDHAVGTEWVNDRLSALIDFTHGCGFGCEYSPDAFPDIIRHTFPEYIITNRRILDEKVGFRKHLNYAFVTGLRFDVSINLCRRTDLSSYPAYGEYVKNFIELREKYRRFFYEGRYESAYDLALPRTVFAGNFIASNGDRITAICNNTDAELTLDVYGKSVTLAPEGYAIVE